MSGRVPANINSRGPLAFVQVNNGATHPNGALPSAVTVPRFVPVAILPLSSPGPVMSFSACRPYCGEKRTVDPRCCCFNASPPGSPGL